MIIYFNLSDLETFDCLFFLYFLNHLLKAVKFNTERIIIHQTAIFS